MKKNKHLLIYIYLLHILVSSCEQGSKKTISVESLQKKNTNKKIEINGEKVKFFKLDNTKAEVLDIPLDITDFKLVDLSKLISNIEIIPLETNNKSIIGHIDKILYDSDCYFLYDKRNNKLLRFNSEGEFLNVIGTIGNGPQELHSIWDVAINNKKKFISILDAKARRISKYTFSGEYLDSQPLYYAMSQHEYVNKNLEVSNIFFPMKSSSIIEDRYFKQISHLE